MSLTRAGDDHGRMMPLQEMPAAFRVSETFDPDGALRTRGDASDGFRIRPICDRWAVDGRHACAPLVSETDDPSVNDISARPQNLGSVKSRSNSGDEVAKC